MSGPSVLFIFTEPSRAQPLASSTTKPYTPEHKSECRLPVSPSYQTTERFPDPPIGERVAEPSQAPHVASVVIY